MHAQCTREHYPRTAAATDTTAFRRTPLSGSPSWAASPHTRFSTAQSAQCAQYFGLPMPTTVRNPPLKTSIPTNPYTRRAPYSGLWTASATKAIAIPITYHGCVGSYAAHHVAKHAHGKDTKQQRLKHEDPHK